MANFRTLEPSKFRQKPLKDNSSCLFVCRHLAENIYIWVTAYNWKSASLWVYVRPPRCLSPITISRRRSSNYSDAQGRFTQLIVPRMVSPVRLTRSTESTPWGLIMNVVDRFPRTLLSKYIHNGIPNPFNPRPSVGMGYGSLCIMRGHFWCVTLNYERYFRAVMQK